jgi:hypothetical protein
VQKVAKGRQTKLWAGIYKILDYVVKKVYETAKETFNIYNASPESVIFPYKLKIAKVVRLYKKWDTGDIQNYRPIALLSFFFFQNCYRIWCTID